MMKIKGTLVATLAAALVFSAPASSAAEPLGGQGRRVGSIRGRVFLPNGRPVTAPVKVVLRQMRGERQPFYTDNEGQFYLPAVEVGVYTVEAEEDRERKYDPGSERVEVFPDSPSLVQVYLKEKDSRFEEKRSANTVSAAELDQNIPPGAEKEFELGTRAGKDGKYAEAVAHMRKALSIHPEYLKARNDLGTFLLAQGKLEEAAAELEAAVKLAPRAFNPRLNLGIVLVRRRDFAGAAENLEVALTLDPNSPAAHLYAGLARLGLGQAERAEKDLAAAYELGGSGFALAQFHLGQLYMERGERARALKAFETYLRDRPDAANAEQVRRLIAILR